MKLPAVSFSMLTILLTVIVSCKSVSTSPSSSHTHTEEDIHHTKTGDNNLVKVTSTNSVSNADGQDEIIFEGTNNLFELVQNNSAYFDDNHDVILIKGNNTVIRLINTNIVTLPTSTADTLVIVGNNQKYVMDANQSLSITKPSPTTVVIQLTETTFDTSPFINENIQEEASVKFDYFDSLVTAKYAYTYFISKLNTQQPEYYYQLAEMYFYGLGVSESVEKAIELYEYAAAKDHIPSLIKLGFIYKNNTYIKTDKNKSLYFFKRCQSLGDEYCDEQVKALK